MSIVQIELLMDVVMRESKITQMSDPSESGGLARRTSERAVKRMSHE